jgi:hypothetical protein
MTQETLTSETAPGLRELWIHCARNCLSCTAGVGTWLPARNHLALDLAMAAVLFLLLLRFPHFVASDQLDLSWEQSLGTFLKSHAQAGTDYVFTFGPLGYFYTLAYDPDLWWYSYAWSVILSAVLTTVTILTGRQIGPIDLRLLFYGVYFYFINMEEVRWLVAFLELTCLLIIYRPPFLVLGGAMSFLATMSLIKFTFLVYASIGVGLVSCCWLFDTRRMKALAPVALYSGSVAGIWIALDQSVASFPTYVRNSLEITRGYSAMGYDGPNPTFRASLVVLGISVLLCTMLLRQKPFKVGTVAIALYSLLCLYTSWKHGFVRDDSHVLLFFEFALGLPFVLMAYDAAFFKSAALRILLGVTFLLSLSSWYKERHVSFSSTSIVRESGHRLLANIKRVALPWRAQINMEGDYTRAVKEWELPQVKTVVGDGTVDVLSSGQGVVLLNGLNWTPRPVFQSYAAYTESLLGMNTRHFRGDRAPQFVLLRVEPIDGRFPMLEDSGVLLELMKRYRPVLTEKNYLLMQRGVEWESECDNQHRPCLERTIELGEEVVVDHAPGQFLTLQLEFHETAAGKVLKSLYRPPVVYLKVVTASAVEKEYRLIPEITNSPFLLSPLVENEQSFAGLYTDVQLERIAKFSIAVKPQWGLDCYDSHIQMKLTTGRLPVRE